MQIKVLKPLNSKKRSRCSFNSFQKGPLCVISELKKGIIVSKSENEKTTKLGKNYEVLVDF